MTEYDKDNDNMSFGVEFKGEYKKLQLPFVLLIALGVPTLMIALAINLF